MGGFFEVYPPIFFQINLEISKIVYIFVTSNIKTPIIMSAPKGYYRQLLSNSFPMVRIAFTHTPMYGVTRVDNTNVLRVLDESSDPYAKYYSDGLRSGNMVTIVENQDQDRYFSVGELYFKS